MVASLSNDFDAVSFAFIFSRSANCEVCDDLKWFECGCLCMCVGFATAIEQGSKIRHGQHWPAVLSDENYFNFFSLLSRKCSSI